MVLAMAALLACPLPVRADLESEVEDGIGRWMAEAFIAQRGRLDQPPIEHWISDLGDTLLAHSRRAGLDYHFVALDSPEVNGFALPGGWVFVTAGLLETMETEDELAAVMAHELGHIANRDFQRIFLRTALWLGLTEVLRDNDRHDWVPVAQGAQLVETLSHSRRREREADAEGARIAWEAGYDPRAMASFLGDEPKWSYLQTIFATHPHPDHRTERLATLFAEFRAEDPEGALALARSLLERGRPTAAADALQDPLPARYESERQALLGRATVTAERREASPRGQRLPGEMRSRLVEATGALQAARESSQDVRDHAWKHLRRLWDDEEVERALVVAQAVDPEIANPGYLLTLAESVDILHRAVRGANLLARVLHMRAATSARVSALADRAGEIRAASDRMPELRTLARETIQQAQREAADEVDQSRAMERLAGDYRRSAREVAPLLMELALVGRGDPGGGLVFSRFLLIETRIQLLKDRVAQLDKASDDIAEQTWRAAIDGYRLQTNRAVLEADRADRTAIVRTLAQKTGAPPEALTVGRAEDGAAVGDRALEFLRGRMEDCDDRFGDDLRATYILMRIASLAVKEQFAPSAKGNTAGKGDEKVALRGAVGHPQ